MTSGAWSTSQGRAGSGGFPPRTRQAILARDGNQCTHVDEHGLRCPIADGLEADHIVWQAEARRLGWSDAEMHDESNGVTLCKPHHAERTKAQAAIGRARKSRRRPQRERHPGLR
jgi:5-methylcytosine-specific restriction protein A